MSLSVPPGGFPAAVAEIRERLGDLPLLLAGMIGSNRGWKEAPYVPAPAGVDDLVERARLGRGARSDRSRRLLHRQRPRRRHAGRGSAGARRRCSRPRRPRRPRLPSGHAQQMGHAAERRDPQLRHGDDRRAVQPAEVAQHPCRPVAGPGRAERCVQGRGVRARARNARCFRPSCSRCARGVLLGTGRERGRGFLCQRLADRHRRADRAVLADLLPRSR